MELKKIIGAQVIRIMATTESEQRPPAFVAFLRAIEHKFSFLQGPRLQSDYDLRKGIAYQRGIFNDEIIDRFTLYNNGLMSEVANDSDLGDAFLDEVLKWGEAEFQFLPKGRDGAPRYYESAVEVSADVNIAQALKKYSGIANTISSLLKSYSQPPVAYESIGLKIHGDTTKLGEDDLFPTAFSFERRASQPYESNVYYSSAPLRTKDHLEVLKWLEPLLQN